MRLDYTELLNSENSTLFMEEMVMRDLLVTLASIRRVPLWTHFYVFCFVFFLFFVF